MKFITILFPLLFLAFEMVLPLNTMEIMNSTRVKEAYADKKKIVDKTIGEHGISGDELEIYLRAFKTEKIIELWAKNNSDSAFTFIKTFPICEISGNVGPKRRSRDLQVPEGFYQISSLNPYSKYYLSMQINYPNPSDSIRGVPGHLGNLIFIHGECVSSGCLAITNDKIKELVVYSLEAYKSGQEVIEIAIFPAKFDDSNYARLTTTYKNDKDKIALWADLKKSYDFFEKTKIPASVKFLKDGSHKID